MTDEGQDPKDQQSQVDTSDNTTTPPAGSDDGQSDDELKRTRSEAAKYRTELRDAKSQLKELATKQKEREDAEKSELQKQTERGTVLEAQVREAGEKVRKLTLQNATFQKSVELGIVDPDAAFRLLDLDDVEWDEDKPTNVEDLLTKLVDRKPYLKGDTKKAPPKVQSTNPPTKSGKGDAALTMEDVQRMSDDEVAERLPEVMEVMAKSGTGGR